MERVRTTVRMLVHEAGFVCSVSFVSVWPGSVAARSPAEHEVRMFVESGAGAKTRRQHTQTPRRVVIITIPMSPPAPAPTTITTIIAVSITMTSTGTITITLTVTMTITIIIYRHCCYYQRAADAM